MASVTFPQEVIDVCGRLTGTTRLKVLKNMLLTAADEAERNAVQAAILCIMIDGTLKINYAYHTSPVANDPAENPAPEAGNH